MRAEPSVPHRKLVAPSMARNLGLRRAALRHRWADETNYLMSNPANRWIMDSIAGPDHWREITGQPPFTLADSLEAGWGSADPYGSRASWQPPRTASGREGWEACPEETDEH